MIHHISIQLLQISPRYKIVFANDVEELGTNPMSASSVAKNFSHQVLE